MEEKFSISGERCETLFVICYTLYVKDQPKSTKPFKSFKSLKTSIQLTGNSSIRKLVDD